MTEKSYILTGKKFQGSVLFKFGLTGYLTAFKVQGILTDVQLKALYKFIPLHFSQVKNLKNLGDVSIDEVPVDLSFDNFWKTYGNYAGKKKSCRQMWENLSQADKTSALNFIPIYKQRKILDKTALAYPDTYLRNRIWD